MLMYTIWLKTFKLKILVSKRNFIRDFNCNIISLMYQNIQSFRNWLPFLNYIEQWQLLDDQKHRASFIYNEVGENKAL